MKVVGAVIRAQAAFRQVTDKTKYLFQLDAWDSGTGFKSCDRQDPASATGLVTYDCKGSVNVCPV